MTWDEAKMDRSILFRYILQPIFGRITDALNKIFDGWFYGRDWR